MASKIGKRICIDTNDVVASRYVENTIDYVCPSGIKIVESVTIVPKEVGTAKLMLPLLRR